jgi:hypothetical protein
VHHGAVDHDEAHDFALGGCGNHVALGQGFVVQEPDVTFHVAVQGEADFPHRFAGAKPWGWLLSAGIGRPGAAGSMPSMARSVPRRHRPPWGGNRRRKTCRPAGACVFRRLHGSGFIRLHVRLTQVMSWHGAGEWWAEWADQPGSWPMPCFAGLGSCRAVAMPCHMAIAPCVHSHHARAGRTRRPARPCPPCPCPGRGEGKGYADSSWNGPWHDRGSAWAHPAPDGTGPAEPDRGVA